MPLAIDGCVYARGVFGGNPSNTVTLPPLTTANAGDLIILTVSNVQAPITSVIGSTLGNFTRLGASSATNPPAVEVWAQIRPR
jgi:hypothetical protein